MVLLYLVLHIGGDPRRLLFWGPILTRIKNRLSWWKSRSLSFGGRLTFFKYVMTFQSVYTFSFFKDP